MAAVRRVIDQASTLPSHTTKRTDSYPHLKPYSFAVSAARSNCIDAPTGMSFSAAIKVAVLAILTE